MIVPLVVAFAFFMEFVDATVLTTALPDMARDLGATPAEVSITITAYIVSLAVFIPASGWMCDRFGTRTVFRAAIAIFTLASLFCGISETLPQLIAARSLQGIGGAMMVPVGRLIILKSFPKSEFLRAMSYVTVPAFLGPVVGPAIGGYLSTYMSWRWIFFVNLPFGFIAIALVSLYIKNFKAEKPAALDWLGSILTGASLMALMYAFDMVGANKTDDKITLTVLFAGGLLLGILAILHARRHKAPILDLSLFKIPTFLIANDAGSIFRIAHGGMSILTPILLQLGFGMTAFHSGLVTLCAALGSVVAKGTTRNWLKRMGFRSMLIWNTTGSGLSLFVLCLFTPSTPVFIMIAVLIGSSYLRSMEYLALSTLVFSDVPPPQASGAASLGAMSQQMGQGIGVALAAAVLESAPHWTGTAPLSAGAIQWTIAVMGAMMLVGALFFLRLPKNAGESVSGHQAFKPTPFQNQEVSR